MRRLESHQKVLGVGLSKTGTTSLAQALNLLAVKTIHNPHDGGTYRELRSGDLRLSILEEYQGVTDIPIATYYAQLDRVYPGSKFILTVRDEDSWIRSARNHWRLMPSWEADEFYTFLHARVYGCLEFDEKAFRAAYATHRRGVIDYFDGRPDDFLVMDITAGDGWDKLCPFLGVSVPDAPFPHRNTARETEEWGTRLRRTVEELEREIPADDPFVLVDEQEFGHLLVRGRRPIPFLERDGEYWGRPLDAATGIRELERLRGAGARFIAFAWPAFWWLQHYEPLQRHLDATYPCVLKNERLVVFRLEARTGQP
jgi:hypothetical protein